MLSSGERPRTQPVNLRRVAVALLVVLAVAAFLLSQKGNLDEYRLYFTEDRKAAVFGLEELSEKWTERTLHERFAGFPISCQPYRGSLPADRACGVDVKSYNEIPALFITFFFASDHLIQVSVNVPWWSHGKAYSSLVATLGAPLASQLIPREGIRLHGWRLPGGAALFFNRDQPLNPLTWNAIFWNSASTCAKRRCFKTNEP